VDGLLARPAHAVYGDCRYGDGKVCQHDAETADVRPLLPCLGDGPVYHVLYLLGAYAGPLDETREDAR
jgi:hypothetical protein